MAKLTKELQTLWWDWLGTAERLTQVLHQQTVALTLRRVEQIDDLQPTLDALMLKMGEIDDRAAALALELAEQLGTEPNLRSLVGALEKAEAQQVQSLANRVIVVGRNVQLIIDKNRVLIESEIEYIQGTAAIVMREAAEQTQGYGSSAPSRTVAVDQAA
ncbi:MAG: flagellar export chaperone FlgN [Fimbriimonadaceae bacterium]|nr:flagellar export chaperone FlgN [Fimbriimonadaceae bacterium]